MRLKTEKTIVLVVSLTIVALVAIQSSRAYLTAQQQEQPGTLAGYIEEAQINSRTSVTFSAGIGENRIPNSWDDVIAGFSFLVVEPTEVKATTPLLTDTTISSWYRFRIIETLSSKPAPFAINHPPTEMGPPQSNEVLMYKWGGTVTLSGITLTAEDPPYPSFVLGQTYLLVVQVDANTKLANNAMGPEGVYTIGATGQIAPISSLSGVFQGDLASRYGSSLNQLRSALAQ